MELSRVLFRSNIFQKLLLVILLHMQQPSASRWPTKTMINLLPDEYKNLVEREYQGRILTGMLLFFIITVIISIIFLIPSYFISQIEYSSALDRAEKNKQWDISFKNIFF